MKKSLIALAALSAFATAAQAQSSVTVYGSFDVGYNAIDVENLNGTTTSAAQRNHNGVNQATSGGALTSQRFGLRGTEDLGGGLKANFNLEYGFANNMTGDTVTTAAAAANTSAQTTGALTTRTSRVGLESAKFGRLDVGYGLTGLFATVTGHSPLPGNNFIGDVAYSDNTISGTDSRILLNAVRMNGINYTSPNFGGLTARIDAGTNTAKTDGGDTVADVRSTHNGITLNYGSGPLALAATVHQTRIDSSTTSTATTTTDYQALSARYAVTSNLAVNALYANNKSTAGGLQSAKNDVTQVGVSYTMGKTQLVAQYGEGEGEGTDASNARRDRKGHQVGVIYNLSKRTNVYGIYGSQEMTYVTDGTVTAGTKEKVSGYTVGLRHSF
jgi:predicted porin